MHFLALFHCTAASFRRLEQLRGKPLPHRLLAALARCFAQPAHRQRNSAHRAHFDRHLEIRTTDATALHFDHRLRIRERLVEDLERVLAAFSRDRLERAIHDALGYRFLSLAHQHVDEFRDIAARILGIREDLALRNLSASGHLYSVSGESENLLSPGLYSPTNSRQSRRIRRKKSTKLLGGLGLLGAILRTALLAILHTRRVQRTAHHVIAH